MYFSTEQTISTQPPCLSTGQHRHSTLNIDHNCGTAVATTWKIVHTTHSRAMWAWAFFSGMVHVWVQGNIVTANLTLITIVVQQLRWHEKLCTLHTHVPCERERFFSGMVHVWVQSNIVTANLTLIIIVVLQQQLRWHEQTWYKYIFDTVKRFCLHSQCSHLIQTLFHLRWMLRGDAFRFFLNTHTHVPCEHFFSGVGQEAAPAYQTSPRAFDNNAGRLCGSTDYPCALPNLNALYRWSWPWPSELEGCEQPQWRKQQRVQRRQRWPFWETPGRPGCPHIRGQRCRATALPRVGHELTMSQGRIRE